VLVPSGADPHEYEPRPSDIAALAGAKLVVANGGLDSWVTRLKDRSGNAAPLLDLSSTIPNPLPGETKSSIDPHWFHDPRNVAAAARAIAALMAKLDPQGAADFTASANQLGRTATELDAAARSCAQRLLPSESNLITDHDAFAYLAERLGLHLRGTLLPTQSTESAASPRQLNDLGKRIRELRVKAIFPERSLDPKLTRSIAAQTGASSSTQLDADTLGPSGSPDSTWQGMWRLNVSKLIAALSGGRIHCQLPPVKGSNR
jgi:ABC-type Zn uptake system ZnuABC Zn-binding protein ZnuA